MNILLWGAFLLLVLAIMLQIGTIILKQDVDNMSKWLVFISATLLSLFFVMRSMNISYVAFTGMFESILLYVALINFISFAYQVWLSKQGEHEPTNKVDLYSRFLVAGSSILSIALLIFAYFVLGENDVKMPTPALRSPLLLAHVSLALIGEALFAVSFIAAIGAIFIKNKEKRSHSDILSYRCILVGYMIYTVGALILGAIWAQIAWGRWWGWDPKETWALVTWLTYTVYLHMRLILKKSGRVVSLIAIVGFIFTIFTLIGVNYLSGLHSY